MKFTIVMTVYKRDELFNHAVYTVLQQTYPEWELIVIADGRHAKIKKAVEVLKADEYNAFWQNPEIVSRITYVEHPKSPKNTYGNPLRRRGLELATGDYICFLSHDCLLDKDYLSTHKESIDAKGVSCVSVVSMLYWGAPEHRQGKTMLGERDLAAMPEFIGRIPWSQSGKLDMASAKTGEIDLSCYSFPTLEARQVGVFAQDLDASYDADFASYDRCRRLLPVAFTGKTVAGHF